MLMDYFKAGVGILTIFFVFGTLFYKLNESVKIDIRSSEQRTRACKRFNHNPDSEFIFYVYEDNVVICRTRVINQDNSISYHINHFNMPLSHNQ